MLKIFRWLSASRKVLNSQREKCRKINQEGPAKGFFSTNYRFNYFMKTFGLPYLMRGEIRYIVYYNWQDRADPMQIFSIAFLAAIRVSILTYFE